MSDRPRTTRRNLPAPPASASTYEEAVLIAGGPVAWPRDDPPPYVPDLAFVRERMPKRTDRNAYRFHALRFFEDVLAYAQRLEAERDGR